MYPVDIPKMMRRSTLGMNAGDPTLPYTQSRVQRLRIALASRRDGGEERPAVVVALAPTTEHAVTERRRCA